ncbi:cupredoxin domain-containing protein [Candidatus Woesearchaeota archaeon]|nr:cupredoxin domain-containing protein [Candidatus Woesearchaeota archaeon]
MRKLFAVVLLSLFVLLVACTRAQEPSRDLQQVSTPPSPAPAPAAVSSAPSQEVEPVSAQHAQPLSQPADELIQPAKSSAPSPVAKSKFEHASEPVVEQIKKFNIIAKQWAWVPDTITVNLGDEVELNITSQDVPHGFYLPDFGVSQHLGRGESATVKFTADKAGTFGFSCNVYCGAGHGDMVGKLVVNP